MTEKAYLALTIWAEARGQPIRGQVAVGQTILNRIGARWRTIEAVVLAPFQYSCWEEVGGVRNHRSLMAQKELVAVTHEDVARIAALSPRLAVAFTIAEGLLDGLFVDQVEGARHYLNPSVLKKLPSWTRPPAKVVATIGDHDFYVGVA